MRCWFGYLSGVRCRLFHMVQLMPLHPKTPSSLASFKSRLVLPVWFTRRNIYPLTPILIIWHPLSTSSICYDPQHRLCSVYVLDRSLWQPLSRSSLVFLFVLTLYFILHAVLHPVKYNTDLLIYVCCRATRSEMRSSWLRCHCRPLSSTSGQWFMTTAAGPSSWWTTCPATLTTARYHSAS